MACYRIAGRAGGIRSLKPVLTNALMRKPARDPKDGGRREVCQRPADVVRPKVQSIEDRLGNWAARTVGELIERTAWTKACERTLHDAGDLQGLHRKQR